MVAKMWSEVFSPAPMSRYVQVFVSFLQSYSFPIFVLYVLMVSQCWRWKKISGPIEFGKFMFVYNIGLSLINVYCFLGFLKCLLTSNSIYERKFDEALSSVYYIYWITKVIELLDTVFMILRHKFRQISTLHVYHHASMVLLSDLGYSQYAWAAFSMPLMLNALVHVFLYLYYGLTSLGYHPSWKKRLTELQIIQFVIDLVHASVGLVHYNFCFWSICYGFSMLYLFSKFYYNAYLKEKKSE